jgi:type II secretory pathway pseudopilin PulG
MEMLVAMFVFSVVMFASTSAFSKFILFQKNSKAIQQNIEDARFTMELMAKTLRTSSIMASTATSISVYDYSQEKCITYRLNGPKIEKGSVSPATPGDKDTCNFGTITFLPMINNVINRLSLSVFQTTPGPPPRAGKATILMEICANIGCAGGNDRAIIQTTVSLRDYGG